MKTSKHLALRKTHPNLFNVVISVGLCNLIIALFTAFDSPKASLSFTRITSIALAHTPVFWYLVFGISGLLCLVGAFKGYFLARLGLILSAAIGGFLSIGFWLSYFSSGTIGISAPIIWLFYTLVCIFASNEPNINPLSAILQKDIHETIHKDKSDDRI